MTAVARTADPCYPSKSPFSPDSAYPEYRQDDVSAERNSAYSGVRDALILSGLDSQHIGTSQWNPLGELMGQGESVVLKPNLVRESHPRDPRGFEYVMTHGSVIRAVADYVFAAVGSAGRVSVADAPETDSSFEAIVKILQLDELSDYYRSHGLRLELVDLRQEEWTNRGGVIVERRRLAGDPRGSVAFDLEDASEFSGHGGTGHYYGADYDTPAVNSHHAGGRHEYLLSRTVVESDVIVSIPKLKTHKKAGVTLSMKNLVGINADKNWLPHHTEGSPQSGGDEHPTMDFWHTLERRCVSCLHRLALRYPTAGPRVLRVARTSGGKIFGESDSVVRSGNWWGNDTVWRMCLDLNKLASYGRADGSLRDGIPSERRRHFVFVDGIVGGQGQGPMNPDPLPAGIVLFGVNAPSVDAAATYLMGLDPEKIPIVRNAFTLPHYPLVEWGWRDVLIASNDEQWSGRLGSIPISSTLAAQPHFGWSGHIELAGDLAAVDA